MQNRRRFLRTVFGVIGSASLPHVGAKAGSTGSEVRFVSPVGNDRANGTDSSPWRSLEYALKWHGPGRIFVRDGTYVISMGLVIEQVRDLEVLAYPGEKPIIRILGPQEYSLQIGARARNITIAGLTVIRQSSTPGNVIGVGGRRTAIRGCEISFDESARVEKYDGIKILTDDVSITGCEIYNVPNQCIDAVGHRNIEVRGNRMHDSTFGVVIKGGSRDIRILNNECYNLAHTGIGLGGTTGPQWHNYANTDAEIEAAIVANNVVYYEKPNNIGGAIWLKGAKRCAVYNNTLVGGAISVSTGGDPSGLRKFCSDNDIANNIVWRTGNDGILVIDSGNTTGLRLRNNLYWKTTGSGEFKLQGTWLDEQEYRRKVTFDSNSIFAEPQFVDINSRNFTLRAGSPGLDRGAMVNPDIRYEGGGVDVGAFESL